MKFLQIQHGSELYAAEVALRDELLRAPLGLRFTEEELAVEDAQLHFGLLEQSDLVACVVVVKLSTSHAKVRQMAVTRSRQSEGLGRRLLEATETRLAEQGICSIELNAREQAIGFYERLGYRAEGPRFIEVTIEHQKMVKALGEFRQDEQD